MFRAVLMSFWRESRLAVILLAGIALAVPLLSLRGTWTTDPWTAWDLLGAAARWSPGYPVIALAAAMALAAGAWWPDHRTKHVYALTLPVARSRYLWLRYLAGLALLLAIGASLLVGSLIATLRITLPPLVHAYPVALTLRFGLAGLSAYTVLFALSGLTPRMARLIVAVCCALVIVTVAAELLSLEWNPIATVVEALLGPYSPLSIFRARWMLIDV
ncbi:MAG TPA: hypothetical protein PK948_11105 [Gemmatimonadales bacterium]|jgi:hypothetical protein|nr:hypothetical protein [Gemmatimonadales bacterium]